MATLRRHAPENQLERPALREHGRVRLLGAVRDGDKTVPDGSLGTIVHIYAGGKAVEVEFTQPFQAVLTLEARQVSSL